ncbi:MAG: MgtC/SapB family protein, partial [Patescibacteria group bacterium]
MIENLEIFGQLLLATLLGSLIGLERKLARKGAGIRTFALVSLGACLFSLISILMGKSFSSIGSFDPSRIASQVVVGLGFIGAGMIIFEKSRGVRGLTTAAGMWVSGAIGMAVAFKFYSLAIFATILT